MAIGPECTGTRLTRISLGTTGASMVTAWPGPADRAIVAGAGACGVRVSSQGGVLPPPPSRPPMQALKVRASATGAARRDFGLIVSSPVYSRAVWAAPARLQRHLP